MADEISFILKCATRANAYATVYLTRPDRTVPYSVNRVVKNRRYFASGKPEGKILDVSRDDVSLTGLTCPYCNSVHQSHPPEYAFVSCACGSVTCLGASDATTFRCAPDCGNAKPFTELDFAKTLETLT